MKLSIFVFFFISKINIFAAETDGFTARYSLKKEGLSFINTEVNSKFENVIRDLNNEKSNKCNWNKLDDLLGNNIRRPLQGVFEKFILDSNEIPKENIKFENSIYNESTSFHRDILKFGLIFGIGFTPSIRHRDLLIGADKFGHFFNEGYYYYTMAHHFDMSFDKILDVGEALEYVVYGQALGGIYSYADLAANYDGYQFWVDILGINNKGSKYLKCEGGNWNLIKKIDLAEYITPAWDEGMNCNHFNTEEFAQGIAASIKKLEEKNKKRYRCPVFPKQVDGMVKRYMKYTDRMISPLILQKSPI